MPAPDVTHDGNNENEFDSCTVSIKLQLSVLYQIAFTFTESCF